MKHPVSLTIQMTCLFPRWTCYVTDNRGTANGGFWKGFRTHAEMWIWLSKHDYD